MLDFMARPERFELPTTWFVVEKSPFSVQTLARFSFFHQDVKRTPEDTKGHHEAPHCRGIVARKGPCDHPTNC